MSRLPYLYGFLVALVALITLVVTVWAVDRLDAADRGTKRVWWRPWYRTAMVCAIYFGVGLLGRGGADIALVFSLTFLVLLALQLWTGSGLKLHVLETLAMFLCLFGGVALMHKLYPAASGPPDMVDLRRALYVCTFWFLRFIAVGTICIMTRRALVRLIRRVRHTPCAAQDQQ